MSAPTTTQPWLVVVDMQAAFAQPGSAWTVPGYHDVEKQIQILVARFAARVVYTRFVPDPVERGAWSAYYERWSSMRQPAAHPLWELTLPTGDAPIISLPTFSKWGAELAAVVGDAPLVLCGVATDCCVLATALAAVDAGRLVTIATDACGGVSQRHHEQTLSVLSLLSPMVALTTVEDLESRADA